MRLRTASERRSSCAPASCIVAAGWVEQAAEHADGGRLARAVGAQQAVDLAVANLQADVFYGGEIAELLGEVGRADGDLPAQIAVVVPRGKFGRVCALPQRAQLGDEGVFERRLIDAHLVDGDPGAADSSRDPLLLSVGIVDQQVEPVAEALHVEDLFAGAGSRGEKAVCLAQVRRAQLDALCIQAGAQLRRTCRSGGSRPDA